MTTQPDPLTRLEQIVTAVERDLLEQFAARPLAANPELARDSTGRYLLLDAYASLTAARAARDMLAAAMVANPITSQQNADAIRGLLPDHAPTTNDQANTIARIADMADVWETTDPDGTMTRARAAQILRELLS
jgi:hypothetical protein